MAYITREYYRELKKNKLIEHGDWVKLHRLSKDAGLKKGKGYTAHAFRDAVIDGCTTTDEVVELVKALYEPKVDALKSQKQAVKNMKEKLAAI